MRTEVIVHAYDQINGACTYVSLCLSRTSEDVRDGTASPLIASAPCEPETFSSVLGRPTVVQ